MWGSEWWVGGSGPVCGGEGGCVRELICRQFGSFGRFAAFPFRVVERNLPVLDPGEWSDERAFWVYWKTLGREDGSCGWDGVVLESLWRAFVRGRGSWTARSNAFLRRSRWCEGIRREIFFGFVGSRGSFGCCVSLVIPRELIVSILCILVLCRVRVEVTRRYHEDFGIRQGTGGFRALEAVLTCLQRTVLSPSGDDRKTVRRCSLGAGDAVIAANHERMLRMLANGSHVHEGWESAFFVASKCLSGCIHAGRTARIRSIVVGGRESRDVSSHPRDHQCRRGEIAICRVTIGLKVWFERFAEGDRIWTITE